VNEEVTEHASNVLDKMPQPDSDKKVITGQEQYMGGELSVSKTCPEHDTREGPIDTCKVFDSNSLPPTIQCIFQQHDGLPKSWVNVVKVRRNTGIYAMEGENMVFYIQRPAGWVGFCAYLQMDIDVKAEICYS
ncbi:hypothetical protein U1Q18_023249, partial [Sarracenia purpurea var. burkii]